LNHSLSFGSDSALVGVSLKASSGSCTYNTAPTATADSDTVAEDSTNNVIDVLNLGTADSDPEGDSLAVTDCGTATNGTSSVSATGDSCIYTPDPDYAGADNFDYTITDGSGLTDTATVSITVTNSNDPPVAQDDAVTVITSSAGNIFNVLADNGSGVDSDIDGDTLCITSIDTTGTNGTVSIVDAGACDTQISYDAPGSAGSDTFTYTITDGNGGNDTATVTVTVADADNLTSMAATWGLAGDGMTLVITGTSTLGSAGNTFTVDYYDNADRAGTETTFVDSGTDFTTSWVGNDFTLTIGSQGTPLNPVTWFRDRVQVTNTQGGDVTVTLSHDCTMDTAGTYIDFENYDTFTERDAGALSFDTTADAAASNGFYGANTGAGDTLAPGYPCTEAGCGLATRDRADFGTTGSGLNFAATATWFWEYYHYDAGGGDSVFWGYDNTPQGALTSTTSTWNWTTTNQNGSNSASITAGNHYISMWPREGGDVRYDGFLMATGAYAEAGGSTVHPEAAAFTYKIIQPNRCP
jgi:hypothetical protein